MISRFRMMILALAMSACASTPSAKTVATDTVDSVEAAWIVAATACTAQTDPKVKAKCAEVLLPARAALVAAAEDIDNGGANYGCELQQVSQALSFVGSLTSLPPAVKTAQTLIAGIPCVQPSNVATGTLDAAIGLVSLDGGAQ